MSLQSKSFGRLHLKSVIGATLLAAIGPLCALVVTWGPLASAIHVDEAEEVSPEKVEQLRSEPTEDTLRELLEVSVGAANFLFLSGEELRRDADAAMGGMYVRISDPIEITMPFDGDNEVFGVPGWDLDLCSWIVPSLLARAHDVLGEVKYLESAVEYASNWIEYENSLLLPKGLIFNDHATAARAIVLTEIWRQYRNSAIYDPDTGRAFVRYADRLQKFLSKPELFEYRTNHGVMQSLSLLHLSLAFPTLEDTESHTRIGVDRLLKQLRYSVDEEGFILEHSAAYHHNGLRRFAASWRYLGLLDEPIPDDLLMRYEKAVQLNASLLRPDRTLPPFGDTPVRPQAPVPVALIDERSRIAGGISTVDLARVKPDESYIADSAGLAVFWSGLAGWPSLAGLSQTVVHWGNFVSQSHKHADEMSVSLWADGEQWIRSVGSWPYIRSRLRAIGWRSSNAPHWRGEPRLIDRETRLVGKAVSGPVRFLDLQRENARGQVARRQVVVLESRDWIVVDSFSGASESRGEIVWRFSPGMTLRSGERGGEFSIRSSDDQELVVRLGGHGDWKAEQDPNGDAYWNGGIMEHGEIVAAPALRVTAPEGEGMLGAVFSRRLSAAGGMSSWELEAADSWRIIIEDAAGRSIRISRAGGKLSVDDTGKSVIRTNIESPQETMAERATLAASAYDAMRAEYGDPPIAKRPERRTKVSAAIVVAFLGQWVVFLLAALRWRRLYQPAVAASTVGWIGLCAFLHFVFLA